MVAVPVPGSRTARQPGGSPIRPECDHESCKIPRTQLIKVEPMRLKSRYLAVLAAFALALAACGGDEPEAAPEAPPAEEPAAEEPEEAEPEPEPAATLDCQNIEFMVPYSAGGGSDQQVRRLEPALAEYLDTNINIVYREGGAGAVAWLALKESAPDGCTVANVVYPNIVLASMEDGEQTFTADEFTHLGQTETAPQVLAVPLDSEFETWEDFMAAAEANPGGVTVGGTGLNGEVAGEQIMAATGIDFTYVPMEGGVGDTIPLLVGGHVDAALFSSSHVEANNELIRGLALAGPVRSDSANLVDVPTLSELGYDGFDFATSWGVVGPPEMPQEIAQIWNDAIRYATDNDEMRATLVDAGLTPLYTSLDEAAEWNLNVQRAFGIR
jgi:tripartite-type tricarboxylate transporter receptor subunit TctC